MNTLLSGRANGISLPDKEMGMAHESSVALSTLVREGGPPCKLSVEDTSTGEHVETTVPGSAVRALVDVLASMADGNPVTIIPLNAELSTQQAADLMGVSRPYFVKLLDTGKIPYRKVGEQRRVRYSDLDSYLREYRRGALSVLKEMTAEAERLGLYD